MEWEAPAVVLDARPHGEGDALVTVLTEAHGPYRGLARGGLSRRHAGLWQAGNLVQARWAARLADQLGTLSAELVHPAAALAMDDPLSLSLLSSACAVAEGALPEREVHAGAFAGLMAVVAQLPGTPVADLVRWEVTVLAELGYGLDLSACAVSGRVDGLAWVSPRTGRAVSDAAAGRWQDRLLPLPPFLLRGGAGTAGEWRDGLRLTGHFLERDAFGHRVHGPVHGQAGRQALPAARAMLYDRVQGLAPHD